VRLILRIFAYRYLPCSARVCTFSDMKIGRDIAIQFPGLFVVHHNKPNTQVADHSHKEHHLIIPLQGEVHIDIDSQKLIFGPGKMAFVPNDVKHAFLSTNQKEGERLIALIEPSLWKKIDGGLYGPLLLPSQQLCKELLFQLLIDPKRKAVKEMILCFASVLDSALAEGSALKSGMSIEGLLSRAEDPRVRKAVHYLSTHFEGDMRISLLAKASGMSERSLTRLFVKELEMAPKEVLTRLRLEKARELLRSQKKSVTEVCYSVGYSSLSRFVQSYRNNFGVLPSEERL